MQPITKILCKLYSCTPLERRLSSDGFSESRGGCFAVLNKDDPSCASLFLFSEGTIDMQLHIKSLACKLIQAGVVEVSAVVGQQNTASLRILRTLTTKIDYKNGSFVGYGNLEDLKRAASGNFSPGKIV